MPRPVRLTVLAESGRRLALAEGPEQFEKLPGTGARLVLGLGPDPGLAAPPEGPVFYVEAPELEAQMPAQWRAAIPPEWRRLDPGDIGPEHASAETLFYRQNLRLFPSFWGPVWGRVRWLRIGGKAKPGPGPVLLAGAEQGLLVREAREGLEAQGFGVRTISGAELPEILGEVKPLAFVSINLRGVEPDGEALDLLEAAGVPAGAWLVDNPFHLLSSLRTPAWRRLHLFVTDASFMGPLRAHGASRVHHLPLAAWPGFGACPGPDLPELGERLVFVGRSAFPAQGKFFAGQDVPPASRTRASRLLAAGERPDFHWWTRELGLGGLWPGINVRRAGLGADESGRLWRTLCLREAAEALPLTVYGDEGWRRLLPDSVDLRPEVDYYGPLADIYRSAGAVLNATHMHLPAGLTQRHFDVWLAGGVLLTDTTEGLSIFPEELTREITFRAASGIRQAAARLARAPSLRTALSAAWRELIQAEHTYAHRMGTLLSALIG